MASGAYPQVYLHHEDENGVCKCAEGGTGGLEKIEPKMKVTDNILAIDLFEFDAMPKIGPADEIVAIRVHVTGKKVIVFAIYRDPEKTATMGCCTGHGCTCYASGCYC